MPRRPRNATNPQLVEPPSRIDISIGRHAVYRIWLGNGQILAIDCPVSRVWSEPGEFEPEYWRTFWRAGRGQPQGRIARRVVLEAAKIFRTANAPSSAVEP